MYLVPVKLLPSKIDGYGVFALQAISKGTLLWKYMEPCDYRFPADAKLDPILTAFYNHFGYRKPGADYIEMSGDLAMFTNHSDAPNCAFDESHDGDVAIRDIRAGEEITIDYRTIECRPMSFINQDKKE